MSKLVPSEEVIRQVRALSPRTILSFSCGKDSIAAYLAIRDHFEDIVPYFLELVPGLEFVEESLAYYESKLGRHIIRLPHPSLYRWLNNLTFQPPAHAAVIVAARLPNFTYLDIHQMVCEIADLPDSTLVASGVRAADSPMRRIAFSTHGAISHVQKQYYPVWDYQKERLLKLIEDSDIRLPIDYKLFGRSFDGLDLRFMLPMKQHLPRDYRRVCELFPLIDLEIWRYERFGKCSLPTSH